MHSPISLRTRLVATSLLSAVALSAPAFAQDTENNTEDDVIVVNATRTNLSNFDYPGMTSAITLESLDAERPGDLSELLEDVPGVGIGAGPRRTGQTVALRGLGRESVTLLVDGARQNFDSAHDGVLFLDPSLLSRVETVRGSSAALYGSGAAGGVIAFETLEPDDVLTDDEQFGARASAGYRSVNEETRGAAAVFGRQGAFEGIAAIAVRDSGDIALSDGSDLPGSDEVFSSLLSGELDLSDAFEIEASWISFRNDATEPNNGQFAALADPLNPLMAKDVASDSYRVGFEFNPNSDLINLIVTPYYNEGTVDERDLTSGRFISRDLTTTGIRAENRAEFVLGATEFALVTGAEFYEDEQSGFDSTGTNGVRGGVPNGSVEFTGVWAQLEAELDLGAAGSLIVLPGVRFDNFESTSDLAASNEDDAVSPRLAASWAITENVRLFGSWGEAFRAPSLNELYLGGTHFSLPHPVLGPMTFITNEFIPNPNLKPEKTETLELGAGFMTSGLFSDRDRLEVKGAWYRTEGEDFINTAVNFSFDPTCFAPPFFAPCSAGTSFAENLISAELEGFEIAAHYQNGPFELSGAVFDIDGEDEATGDPVGSLQPLSGFIRANYTFAAQNLTLGGRLGFAADFDKVTDPTEERDGYTVVDLIAGWSPLGEDQVRVNFAVENVFDTEYERVFAGVYEPGRSVRIDLTWTGGW